MAMRLRSFALAVMAGTATTLAPALARNSQPTPSTETNAIFAGVVLDSDGKPAKATVVLQAVDPRSFLVVPLDEPVNSFLPEPVITNSDLDGYFEFNVPPGRYTAFATIAGGSRSSDWPSWQKKLAWEEHIEVLAHERQAGIELKLAPFLTVHGHVKSSQPNRLAGKRVYAFM